MTLMVESSGEADEESQALLDAQPPPSLAEELRATV
jgi:hypothetical protein